MKDIPRRAGRTGTVRQTKKESNFALFFSSKPAFGGLARRQLFEKSWAKTFTERIRVQNCLEIIQRVEFLASKVLLGGDERGATRSRKQTRFSSPFSKFF